VGRPGRFLAVFVVDLLELVWHTLFAHAAILRTMRVSRVDMPNSTPQLLHATMMLVMSRIAVWVKRYGLARSDQLTAIAEYSASIKVRCARWCVYAVGFVSCGGLCFMICVCLYFLLCVCVCVCMLLCVSLCAVVYAVVVMSLCVFLWCRCVCVCVCMYVCVNVCVNVCVV
jgi:hypothetical protein